MIKKITSIIIMAISIVLMALPYGVAMKWSVSQTKTSVTYHSYFDPLPSLGYANWFLPIIIILSITTLVLLFVKIKDDKSVVAGKLLIACICAVIFSWMVFRSFTWLSLAITVLHTITCALQFIPKINEKTRRTKFNN